MPALRGKTVVSLFYEDSTRTRLSFETAAKRLGADTLTFSVSSSSVKKGESLRDTVQTIDAFGVDAFVVRHQSSGVPSQVARWTDAAVVNGGDGWHAAPHPGAARRVHRCAATAGRSTGSASAIVGDVKHSRVARSVIAAFTTLGATVTLVAPPTLLPPSLDGWPVAATNDLDAVLAETDICYLLRMQLERQNEGLVPSLREYSARYGLTEARAARLAPKALVMHPGPMNRGVEIAPEVADAPERRDHRAGRQRGGGADGGAVPVAGVGHPARRAAGGLRCLKVGTARTWS